MKTFQKKLVQTIPVRIEKAWDFFSSPLNLSKITPAEMQFKVTSDYTEATKMYPGMIITYHVSPIFGIKMNWITEITHVKEREYFIDEQRFGPYAFWHHQHHFKEVKGGVEMTDILNYAIPYGIIGKMANTILVGRKIDQIFLYRKKAIEKRFGRFDPENQFVK